MSIYSSAAPTRPTVQSKGTAETRRASVAARRAAGVTSGLAAVARVLESEHHWLWTRSGHPMDTQWIIFAKKTLKAVLGRRVAGARFSASDEAEHVCCQEGALALTPD
jgi:hypothetical protein